MIGSYYSSQILGLDYMDIQSKSSMLYHFIVVLFIMMLQMKVCWKYLSKKDWSEFVTEDYWTFKAIELLNRLVITFM